MRLGVEVDQLLALIQMRRHIAARKWKDAYACATELDRLERARVPPGPPHLVPSPPPTEAA